MELVSNSAKDGRMTLIARLRIILNDVDPQPMRHIEVPLKIRLDRLHEVIQAAMGWTDTHLYEFRVGDAGWGMPDPDGFYDGPMDAKKMTLEKLLDQTGTRTIQYIYDFGDDWDHSIRIERVNEAATGITYPRLLKATGACPPEDVGGAWGYEEFLEALADPDHEQHENMVHWSGGDFDAEDAGIDSINERFDRLAKKWAPRPRKPKPTI
ncbi:Plasmid pRiA4b ORF-3-like protein [Roseivivax sp. THAF30]|nr:Plasmid pRiA4b ORF-3-like protein [Roseivivax sp. THAF30]